MNYEEAKRSLASHANLPETDLPIEGSFVGGLWLIAQKNADPRFMQHADEIINCLRTVNTHFNGPDPTSRSGRSDHSRISEVAYFVSGIISGGLTLYLKLNRMRQLDQDSLRQLSVELCRIAYAWDQILASDVSDILEGFDITLA
ncbi:hypothetical protein [Novipirellula caenicola]|uniref:Uncharacterized protein n=1 Tax=Novipirellula caenicola TaxID=1536901 RepID=A0ABP9W282_9BACT